MAQEFAAKQAKVRNLFKSIGFMLFCWILSTQFCAAQSDEKALIAASNGQLIWVSQSSNAENFAKELSDLYLSLYNTGRLTVVTGLHSDASTIEGVVREKHLLIGPIFPLGLESLICDLNAPVCVRNRTVRSAGAGDALSSTIQGVATSRTQTWSATPNTSLTLPDIRLERISKWTRLHKDPGDSLENLVVQTFGGCDAFDDQCKANILAYNRGLDEGVFLPGWKGDISVPVVAARASVNFGPISQSVPPNTTNSEDRPRSDIGVVLKNLPQQTSDKYSQHYKVDPAWEHNKNVGAIVKDPIANEKAITDQIKGNIQSLIRGKLFTVDGAEDDARSLIPKDFAEERKRLCLQTTFPYAKLNDYPSTLRGGNVGVFDGWVDKEHCAFAPGNIKISNLVSGSNTKEKKCDVEERADDQADHGTHVVGIIASRLPSDAEYGINPYAHVFAQQVDLSSLNSQDVGNAQAAVSNLAQEIVNIRLDHNVDVVNMSWGYIKGTAGRDQIESAIKQQIWNVLFVAAAGNDGDDKSNICDIRPACFNFPNVISVAALGKDPNKIELLTKKEKLFSNYGTNIHIAAPGDEVLSTISYGRFGKLSGTSQAAPMVTAVASMLMVEAPSLKPIEVKNRLIYCSDMLPELEGKLFGGVLNADCTLDGFRDRLSLLDGSPVRHGKLQLDASIQVKNTVSGKKLAIPLDAVRGIQANVATGTATIFYNDNPEKIDSLLLKEERVKFVPEGAEISFLPETGPLVHIKLNQIAKYTAAFR